MTRHFSSVHVEECRRIIREGSKSFYFASLMLPSQVRLAATALYAFCRVTDDVADEKGATRKSVARLVDRLDYAYAGDPYDHAADQAFSEVVSHFDIPYEVPRALIEGFEWDVAGKEYETLSDVIAYSARVAGTVGVMMSIVMGRRQPSTLARACDLGLSMQLVNIARDVGEDARNGRLYLPGEWLREAGIDPKAFLKNPRFTPELGMVVKRLLKEAQGFYKRGMVGTGDLPVTCRPGIRAAGMVYAEIGEKVRENGYNSVDERAYTTRGRKLGLMLKSAGNSFEPEWGEQAVIVPEVRFLIDAAAREHDEPFGDGEWVIDLFSEMDRRDRAYLQSVRTGF
ncbi:MAG: phytoene/squalene synthase family protein [Pseudomonadota bacterium]